MRAQHPGPESYRASDPNNTKRSSGCYSMQGRTRVPEYNTAKRNPGPGSYNLEMSRNGGKGFSMGERHSLYTTPLTTELDII